MKLNELTIKQCRDKLDNKEITSVDLVQACIDRIKETDGKLYALLATDFDVALTEAKKFDNGEVLGPLAGIPCTIKDILLTKDIETTAASNMLKGYVPRFDATVVEKLKKAGAIILGKNNLDAWAHGGSTENSDFGPSHNPWDLERVPGGSSGGSAVSVASDQAIFSIGSDTGGSIRQPASYCGVVGLKPTYGRVSRYGSIAMGSSLDCIGPITKTIEDTAIILDIIAGQDEKDGTTLPLEVPGYSGAIKNELKSFKVAVPKSVNELLKGESRKIFDESLEKLKQIGAEIEEVDMNYLEYGIATYYIIMPSEVSSNLGRYDGIRYGFRDDSAKELIEVYEKSRSKGFGAEAKRRIMIGTYVLSHGYYDAYYKKALKVRTLIKNEFEEILSHHDVIAMPTTLGPAFKIGEKSGDPLSMYLEDIFTVTANIAGVPGLSVPSGLVNGLPVGLQLMAKQFNEEKLLQIGYNFELKTGFEKKLAI